MPLAALCASHSPLMNDVQVLPELRREVEAGFRRLAAWIEAFAPDLVIQFSPDHFNGFFYELMPSFCVATAAAAVGDWNTRKGALQVPGSVSGALAEALLADGIDIALSYRMQVDHGCTQIWERMFGRLDAYLIVPIFINCAAPPLPTMRRVRELGEAVGRFARMTEKRVLLAASGGLSHDPPVPDLATASPELRERLIAGRNPPSAVRKEREARMRDMARALAAGEGTLRPLNPAWDRAFIELLKSGDLTRADAYGEAEIREAGGRGAQEIRTWIAALAALSAAGRYTAHVEFYEPIPAWIAGMAMMTAVTAADR
jgi:2,3-dihydroxyphenylpropionate 1,2-dioxygenase